MDKRWKADVWRVYELHHPFPAGLKKLLKKHAVGETLAVLDSKLGSIVKEKMGIDCVYKCAVFLPGLHHPDRNRITFLAVP